MIRYLIHRPTTDGKVYAVIAGLSTDTKPTAGLITGSRFVAADTGARYMFDESAGQWNETDSQDQIDAAVQAWLDDHPEATTTVEDGSITKTKLHDDLAGEIDDNTAAVAALEDDVGGLKSAIDHVEKNTLGSAVKTRKQFSISANASVLSVPTPVGKYRIDGENIANVTRFERYELKNGTYSYKEALSVSDGAISKEFEITADDVTTWIWCVVASGTASGTLILYDLYDNNNLQAQISSVQAQANQNSADITNIENELSEANLAESVDFSDPEGGYVDARGYIVPSEYFSHVGPIALKAGQKIHASLKGYNDGTSILVAIAEYNSGTYISLVNCIDATVREYEYTATRNMNVVISYNNTAEKSGYIIFAVDQLSDYFVQNYADKKIVFLGDSIYGMYDDATSVPNNVAMITGATVINCAFGGTRASASDADSDFDKFQFVNLVPSIVSGDFSVQEAALEGTGIPEYFAARLTRLAAVDFDTVNIIVLNYGTNDYASGVGKTKYENALKLIGTLQEAYPQIKFILASPTWRCWTSPSYEDSDTKTFNGNDTLIDFCGYSKEVADELHIIWIDCYNIGINTHNYSTYLADGTHHNPFGRKYLGDYLGRKLLSN